LSEIKRIGGYDEKNKNNIPDHPDRIDRVVFPVQEKVFR